MISEVRSPSVTMRVHKVASAWLRSLVARGLCDGGNLCGVGFYDFVSGGNNDIFVGRNL